MKKSKILCLAAGSMIAIGLVIYMIGFVLGGRVVSVGINSGGLFVLGANGTYGKDGNRKGYFNEKELELKSFENLEIQTDFAEVQILESDHFGVLLGEFSEHPFRFDQTGKTLKISQQNQFSFQMNLFMLPFGTFGKAMGDAYLTVYVPAGTKLNSISIKSSTGDVTLEDLAAKELVLRNDFGKMNLVNLNTSGIDARISTGNMNLTGTTTESLKLKGDFSEIYLEDSAVTGSANITTATGGIKSRNSALSQTEIKTDFGDISLDLTSPSTEYKLDLSTEFGDISVDNSTYTNHISTTSQTPNFIKIRCSTGNIRITSPVS